MQDSKCKIPFQFFQMLVINKITCKSFRTSLPPRASRKQLTSCSSTPQNAKSHITSFFNCVLTPARHLFDEITLIPLKNKLPSRTSKKQLTSRSSTPPLTWLPSYHIISYLFLNSCTIFIRKRLHFAGQFGRFPINAFRKQLTGYSSTPKNLKLCVTPFQNTVQVPPYALFG